FAGVSFMMRGLFGQAGCCLWVTRQSLQDGFQEFRSADGLEQASGDSEFLTATEVSTSLARGEHHHGMAREARDAADSLCQSESIHPRHVPINQDQGKGMAPFAGQLDFAQCIQAAFRGGWLHTPLAEEAIQYLPVCSVIVDNQGRHPVQQYRTRFNARAKGVAGSEFRGKMKCATLPWHTVHPDAPVHHPDNAGRDGKSEARAAMFARC